MERNLKLRSLKFKLKMDGKGLIIALLLEIKNCYQKANRDSQPNYYTRKLHFIGGEKDYISNVKKT